HRLPLRLLVARPSGVRPGRPAPPRRRRGGRARRVFPGRHLPPPPQVELHPRRRRRHGRPRRPSGAPPQRKGSMMSEEVNGVPCDKMFGSIARFRENGDLAAFRFSAKNEWVEGTASQSTIYEWYGLG